MLDELRRPARELRRGDEVMVVSTRVRTARNREHQLQVVCEPVSRLGVIEAPLTVECRQSSELFHEGMMTKFATRILNVNPQQRVDRLQLGVELQDFLEELDSLLAVLRDRLWYSACHVEVSVRRVRPRRAW